MKDKTSEQLTVTEKDTNRAWERLLEQVKKEPTSDFWMNAAEAGQTEQNHSIHPAEHAAPPEAGLAPSTGESRAWVGASDETTVRRKKPIRRTKRWLSAGMAALLAGLLLLSPSGQKVMASMLSTLRIQHFETVSLTKTDLDAIRQAIVEGTKADQQFNLKRYGDIELRSGGEARMLHMDEANQLAGHALKQLPGVSLQEVTYQPQQKLILKLHTSQINTLIALLGGGTSFPKSADGKPIELHLPGTFLMQASKSGTGTASGKRLTQLPAPSLDVPEGVDLEQVRQAILDLPMLPDAIRSKLAGIGDWRHTLPIPANADQARSLIILGQEAVLSANDHGRSLIWLQDGWVYELKGSNIDYPSDDTLIHEAQGLIQS